MDYDKAREIKIEIIEAIQAAEEELGFELDAAQEAGLSEIIFNKLEKRIK
jgi:hypothetical protein